MKLWMRLTIITILIANIAFLVTRYPERLQGLQIPILQQVVTILNKDQESTAQVASVVDSLETEPHEFMAMLQKRRQDLGLPMYQETESLCEAVEALVEDTETDIFAHCTTCSDAITLRVSSHATPERLVVELENSMEDVNLVTQENYRYACVAKANKELVALFANMFDEAPGSSDNTGSQTPPSVKVITPQVNQFTEDELWQALTDYRHAHKMPDLQRDEMLCEYARERVAEHIELFATTAKDAYPNQDKYPLDAHEGFRRDGDSGYLFEATGKNAVAENLAYWPTALVAHHVIEWGWDTSTEGHRELQLTSDYPYACVSGQDGFYVAIFGR